MVKLAMFSLKKLQPVLTEICSGPNSETPNRPTAAAGHNNDSKPAGYSLIKLLSALKKYINSVKQLPTVMGT